MIGTQQAAEVVREQALLEEVAHLQIGEITDRKVDLARLESLA